MEQAGGGATAAADPFGERLKVVSATGIPWWQFSRVRCVSVGSHPPGPTVSHRTSGLGGLRQNVPVTQHVSQQSGSSALAAYLDDLDSPELRALVRELADRDEKVARLLELRAAGDGFDREASAELTSMVSAALRTRGFVHYRESFGVAQDAAEVLGELESHLDGGAADTVRAPLLRALNRLVKITQQADDSSGVLGDQCQRAADLYARSCRQGKPERRKLARWLVKFRDESPRWPDLTLEDFVDCFDEGAMTAYRKAVADLAAGTTQSAYRFELDRMLLELADHDGDVDRAIEILSSGRGVTYGGIIARLLAADRDAEALRWTDRAVADGRIAADDGNEYWLGAAEVADRYASVGRSEDGLAVLRSAFRKRPGRATFGRLVSFADTIGRADAERDWALGEGRRQAAAPAAVAPR